MKHELALNRMFCYYSMNPNMRSFTPSEGCRYCQDIVVNGKVTEVRCAIGLFIKDDVAKKLKDDPEYNSVGVITLFDKFKKAEIAPELDEINSNFLAQLQKLHDNQGFWEDFAAPHGNASERRHEYYQELLEIAKKLDNNEIVIFDLL